MGNKFAPADAETVGLESPDNAKLPDEVGSESEFEGGEKGLDPIGLENGFRDNGDGPMRDEFVIRDQQRADDVGIFQHKLAARGR